MQVSQFKRPRLRDEKIDPLITRCESYLWILGGIGHFVLNRSFSHLGKALIPGLLFGVSYAYIRNKHPYGYPLAIGTSVGITVASINRYYYLLPKKSKFVMGIMTFGALNTAYFLYRLI
eukprot:TRINITY_DN161_c0_g1_i5.p1 TRINITY_DN161_c0_g1~~TRINITY_DN161_c0_g1_i5.p1  ORF type:complete len:119 (+),score=17.99 TRINITY_DN161_c0_g1_i5:193-549(+)